MHFWHRVTWALAAAVTECARSIYDTVKLIGTPGHVYSYNSNHLQIAAALAVAATGLDIKAVIRKYLVRRGPAAARAWAPAEPLPAYPPEHGTLAARVSAAAVRDAEQLV